MRLFLKIIGKNVVTKPSQ